MVHLLCNIFSLDRGDCTAISVLSLLLQLVRLIHDLVVLIRVPLFDALQDLLLRTLHGLHLEQEVATQLVLVIGPLVGVKQRITERVEEAVVDEALVEVVAPAVLRRAQDEASLEDALGLRWSKCLKLL